MTRLSDAAVARLRELVERPDTLGRYDVGECIGEGGMGAVYAARDRELGREVAIKVLLAPLPTPEERERLVREARILASLEHPGIVPVHDVGTLDDGRFFYVMKRVRGERFDDFARGHRTRTELLRSFLQACDAVAFAHSAGVVHRDLKPQNVMLGAFGEVLVLDWGVARTRRLQVPADQNTSGSNDPTATAAGTPGYMAPEQAHGAADECVDVYGLGGVLFFLLTRAHPSPNLETVHQWESHEVPPALRAICERARMTDPMLRYTSVAALASDVANYLDALPVAAHSEGVFERVRRVAVRHRTAILLVLGYLVMRVALIVLSRR
jgi:serine/threonine protein kinase